MTRVHLLNGRITLINGDCIEILPKIKPNVIDLICADPPYFRVVKAAWDNDWKDLNAYLAWSKQWITVSIPSLKLSGSFYMWGGIGEQSDSIIHLKLLIDTLGLHFKDWITWKKDRGMGTRRGWVYAREECLWYVKNNKEFIWNELFQYGDERRKRDKGLPAGQIRVSQNGYYAKSEFKRLTSVWTDISEQSFDVMSRKNHSTPKPLLAIERIVQVHTTSTENIVLDPFMGSGTTGEVCVKLNRRFIGIEKDPQTFKEAVKTIEATILEQSNVTQ